MAAAPDWPDMRMTVGHDVAFTCTDEHGVRVDTYPQFAEAETTINGREARTVIVGDGSLPDEDFAALADGELRAEFAELAASVG